MQQDITGNTVAWPLALAAAAVMGSLATACMMPFVAIATLAAATMPRTQAVIAVLGVWAANQLLGFGLLGYPMTAYAAVWGVAMGAASVVALFVARRFNTAASPTASGLLAAFAVAFTAYEMLLFLFALWAGGTDTFTVAIMLRILANDAIWFVGLALLNIILARAVPRLFGRPLRLRLS